MFVPTRGDTGPAKGFVPAAAVGGAARFGSPGGGGQLLLHAGPPGAGAEAEAQLAAELAEQLGGGGSPSLSDCTAELPLADQSWLQHMVQASADEPAARAVRANRPVGSAVSRRPSFGATCRGCRGQSDGLYRAAGSGTAERTPGYKYYCRACAGDRRPWGV
jgi:hypothetical protein